MCGGFEKIREKKNKVESERLAGYQTVIEG
jgi:hypothetical protein